MRRPADDLGWRRLVKGVLTVRTMKGSHETMLAEPFVAELAERLKEAIDGVIAADAASSGSPEAPRRPMPTG